MVLPYLLALAKFILCVAVLFAVLVIFCLITAFIDMKKDEKALKKESEKKAKNEFEKQVEHARNIVKTAAVWHQQQDKQEFTERAYKEREPIDLNTPELSGLGSDKAIGKSRDRATLLGYDYGISIGDSKNIKKEKKESFIFKL